MRIAYLLILCGTLSSAEHRLMVISIDGLDTRYLHEADRLGLRIPTLRKMMREGAVASGVMGVVPTVTWPSHTSIVSGVPPEEHGILTNDQPGQPGQRWWFTSFLKGRTLWQATLEKGKRVATVYWPVTLGPGITFNFPEFWTKRTEHDILFNPIAERATSGLEEKITRVYPAFPRALWSDDAGMTAVRYLLEFEKPELVLVHIADLDSNAHEFGAFSKHANATLEHADQLIAWALEKRPPGMVVAIVSDHGFENEDFTVRPKALHKDAQAAEGLIGARSAEAADFFRGQIGKNGIAREVPMEQVRRLAPALSAWVAAFDTLPGYVVKGGDSGPAVSPGTGRGTHGLWPARANYRASFLLWGEGVRKYQLGEIGMLQEAPTFAEIVGVGLPAAKEASLWRLAKN